MISNIVVLFNVCDSWLLQLFCSIFDIQMFAGQCTFQSHENSAIKKVFQHSLIYMLHVLTYVSMSSPTYSTVGSSCLSSIMKENIDILEIKKKNTVRLLKKLYLVQIHDNMSLDMTTTLFFFFFFFFFFLLFA